MPGDETSGLPGQDGVHGEVPGHLVLQPRVGVGQAAGVAVRWNMPLQMVSVRDLGGHERNDRDPGEPGEANAQHAALRLPTIYCPFLPYRSDIKLLAAYQ